MKLEKFLTWIQDKLLNYPDISFPTVKLFIQEFYNCLSEKEKERYIINYRMISEFTLKQITLDYYVKETVIDNLINELNNVKKDDG